MADLKSVFNLSASVAMIVASACLIWMALTYTASTPRSPKIPEEPINIQDAAMTGHAQSPVVMIEYGDFECPYTREFARLVFPFANENYISKGRLLFAFKHLPLTSIHRFAEQAAEIAECARRQNKFWQLHDAFTEKGADWNDSFLLQQPSKAGLEPAALSSCLKSEGKEVVRADVAAAKTLGIDRTPTFLLGSLEPSGRVRVKKIVVGMPTISKFKETIDPLLSDRVTQVPAVR